MKKKKAKRKKTKKDEELGGEIWSRLEGLEDMVSKVFPRQRTQKKIREPLRPVFSNQRCFAKISWKGQDEHPVDRISHKGNTLLFSLWFDLFQITSVATHVTMLLLNLTNPSAITWHIVKTLPGPDAGDPCTQTVAPYTHHQRATQFTTLIAELSHQP